MYVITISKKKRGYEFEIKQGESDGRVLKEVREN